MQAILQAFKDLVDVFKLGRIVFYPIVGAIVIVPLDLVIRMILHEPDYVKGMTWRAVLLHDMSRLGRGGHWELGALIMGAIIAGFVVAVFGFSVTIKGLYEECATRETAAKPVTYADKYFALTKGKKEDYAAWFDAEYYRFLEIATFFPVALGFASVLLMVYGSQLHAPPLGYFAIQIACLLGCYLFVKTVTPRIAEGCAANQKALLEELARQPAPSNQLADATNDDAGNDRDGVNGDGKRTAAGGETSPAATSASQHERAQTVGLPPFQS